MVSIQALAHHLVLEPSVSDNRAAALYRLNNFRRLIACQGESGGLGVDFHDPS